MKKLLSVVLSFCIVMTTFALLSTSAGAADETVTSGDFEYIVLEDGTAKIINQISLKTTVEVPAEIDGYKVTSIAADAFYHNFYLESITVSADNEYFSSIDGVLFNADKTLLIAYPCGRKEAEYTVPEGVTKIGDDAFGSVHTLKNISFPNTLTHIGYSSFSNSALESVVLPQSVETIGERAFLGSSNLKSVTLSSNMTEIPHTAFSNCSKLADVEIPEGITTIGFNAFDYCTALEAVTFPDTLKEIGYYAFGDCINLADIVFPDNLETVFDDSFGNTLWYENQPDGVMYASKVAFGYKGEAPEDTKIVFKEGTTSIPSSSFSYCDWVTEIEIPDSVRTIGASAFARCTNLKRATLPNGLSIIPSQLFSRCSQLEEVTIPNSVEEISFYAFYNCTSLTSITIPQSVTVINSMAFQNTPLETIYGYKDSYARQFATENEITFIALDEEPAPADFEYIVLEDGTAEITKYLSSETTVEIPAEIDGFKVTSIGEKAFLLCSQITSVEIPHGVTKIGNSAFQNCLALETITLPDSLKEINDLAFYNCIALETITLPNALKEIGDYAFYGCTTLESVTLPDTLEKIGSRTFSGCSALKAIDLPDSLKEIEAYAFVDCTLLKDIYFPDSLEKISGGSLHNTLWYENQPDGVVYAGKVAYDYKGEAPEDTKIVLKDDTIAIASSAFYYCDWITEIVIPDSVRTIGTAAFMGCSALKKVDLPDALTEISTQMLHGCTSLETVDIPDGVEKIWGNVFRNCASLTTITIPKSVTSISSTAFQNTPIEIIYGYTGSTAEQFAAENNITFIALDGELPECDLYVSSASTVQSNIADGDQISFRATVRNIGENESTSYTASFYMNGRLIDTVEIENSVRAGGTAQITSNATSTAFFGKGSVTVIIECANDNENSNDRMKSRFTVE